MILHNINSIFILILVFVIINIYYKNIINIVILSISFVIFKYLLNNNLYALIIGYVLSISYGILNNFHLIGNFTNYITNSNLKNTKNNEATKNNKNNVSTKNNKNNKSTKNNKNNEATKNNEPIKNNKNNEATKNNINIQKDYKSVNEYPKIDNIISEALINKFINKIKKTDDLLVSSDIKNIYEIYPTNKVLSNSKIEKMKTNILNKTFNFKPIIISKDNFIIDGHHRWYSLKNLIENNESNYINLSENIKVIIINYNINKLIQKLQEYKIHYNKNYLDKSIKDLNNITKSRDIISNLKTNINLLEDNFNKMENINLI